MSQTTKTVIVAAIVGLAAAFIGVKMFRPQMTADGVVVEVKEESTYERILRTKTIRCGYTPWPALVDVDPNTGELSGTFVDYLEALGESMDLRIEWTMEIGFGDFIEALRSQKIDAQCSGTWTNPKRGMYVDFITPISYQGMYAFVSADDIRFDNNLSLINSPDVTVSAIEGSTGEEVPMTFFKEAKLLSLPQLTEVAQQLMNVSTGKADVTFTERHSVFEFIQNNPNTLREVPADYPVRLFGNPIAIRKGEPELREMLNNATQQLINIGVIEQILQKHEKYPGTFTRAATTFEE